MIIGNGNVAADVARMLTLDAAELERTDTAEHALEALRASGIEEVVVLGRRGPAQAAFTSAELREMGHMEGVDLYVDPAAVELDPVSRSGWRRRAPSPPARTWSCCASSPRPSPRAPRAGSSCAS